MNSGNSPSRETAKQRALRVPLDYYRQGTWLNRTKWLLTLAAVVITGAYLAWVLLPGNEPAAQHLSPAPVAASHAAWEGQCSACHVNYSPLRSDAEGIALLMAAFTKGGNSKAGEAHSGAHDAKCTSCHAGPAHHSNQLENEVVACATCHRDHQGRDANIARVADTLCTSCHAQLANHRKGDSLLAGKAPEHAATITTFAKGSHPDFRSLTGGDPGNIKFNHALHLMPGQYPAEEPADAAAQPGAGPKRLQDIPERLQPMYRPYAGADGIIRLDCSACHQLEGPSAAGGATPALGAYMQPIVFEQHCAACHPNNLVIDRIPQNLQGDIPHGLEPAEVRELLLGRLLSDGKAEPIKLSPDNPADAPAQPIPGKTPGENLAQQLQMSPSELVGYAQTQLASQHKCGKCHHFQNESAEGLMSAVKPSAIPTTWLKHAKFDHSAHRAVSCIECHKVSEAPSKAKIGNPQDDTWAMIPTMDNCLQCHAPRQHAGQGIVGGARFNCAECHRYHAGDTPPHGIGSWERGVQFDQRKGIAPFISGESGKAK